MALEVKLDELNLDNDKSKDHFDAVLKQKAKTLDINLKGLGHLLDQNYPTKNMIKHTPIGGEEEDIIYIENLLSHKECDFLIEMTEKLGYSYAEGFDKKVRSNQRRRTFDKQMSRIMFERLKPFLPETKIIDGCIWKLDKFLDYWRYCKYDCNEHFSPHYDGSKMFLDYSMSIYTINIYLNSKNIDFKGGDTRFYMKCQQNAIENDSKESNHVTNIVSSQKGGALIFNHCNKGYLHDGQALTSGKKYIMRADLVYKCIDKDVAKLKRLIELNEKNELKDKYVDKYHGKRTKKRGKLFYDYQCAKSHTVINYVGRKWKCACVSNDVTVTLF